MCLFELNDKRNIILIIPCSDFGVVGALSLVVVSGVEGGGIGEEVGRSERFLEVWIFSDCSKSDLSRETWLRYGARWWRQT